MSRYKEIDPAQLTLLSVRDRKTRVTREQFGRPLPDPASVEALFESLPDLLAGRASPEVAALVRQVVGRVREILAALRDLGPPPRALLAPLLAARLTRRYAKQLERAGFDPFAPGVADRPPWMAFDLGVAALLRRL